jgi:magnesium transporter
MEKNFYILDESGVQEITKVDFSKANENLSSLYLVEIKATNRDIVPAALADLNVPTFICEKTTTPSENIRFDYFEDTLYGEVSTFSSNTRKSNYSGVIINKNVIIGIHNEADSILDKVNHYLQNFIKLSRQKISAESFLFSMVHEILSEYGKMILSYREEIEKFANHLDEQSDTLSPQKLLTSKSQLSEFSRVLERLFYTLSFPPTKDILDDKSSYRESFDYLLKITTLLTSSIQQTEDRLESLNDYYQLLLQNRANKRLNLTIVQAIFVPLTLLAGIYGMNFNHMLERAYHNAYFVSLGGMLLFVIISSIFFTENDGLKTSLSY